MARGQSGTLRVGFTENASWRGVVPESIRCFRERQPDAELQLNPATSLEQIEALRSGRLDAGFVFNMAKTDAELEYIPVALQHVELAVPKGHPLVKLEETPVAGSQGCVLCVVPATGGSGVLRPADARTFPRRP